MRSKWKVKYLHRSILRVKDLTRKIFFSRSSLIPESFINSKVKIYNGIWPLSVLVSPQHVGYRLGEFSITKRLGSSIHEIKVRTKKKKN